MVGIVGVGVVSITGGVVVFGGLFVFVVPAIINFVIIIRGVEH